MKTIFKFLLIIIVIIGINFLRAEILKGNVLKTTGVMKRFYDAKYRMVEIEDEKSKSKYIRNGNFYQLVYEDKKAKNEEEKIVNFYYNSETKKGFSVIGDKVNKIEEDKLYLETQNKEKKENKEEDKEESKEKEVKSKEDEKTAKEIDEKIKGAKEDHEKNEENAKNIDEVAKEEKDEKEAKLEEEAKEDRKTFIEVYTGPKIVEDFANKAFFVFKIRNNEKNENKFLDIKGNYLITDSKTDYVKEIKYNGKIYKYFNYSLSDVDKIKMPDIKDA